MPRLAISLFLTLLLTLPVAAMASPADDGEDAPWSMQVTAFRVGDQVRYSELAADGRRVSVVEARPIAEVIDRFGIARTSESFLTVDYLDGVIENGWTCHLAQGTRTTLRRDVLAGVRAQDGKAGKPGQGVGGEPIAWGRSVDYDWQLATDFPAECLGESEGPHALTGARLAVGERFSLKSVAGRRVPGFEARSEPAIRTWFAGHDALEIRFNATSISSSTHTPASSSADTTAVLAYVFADGLPGLAARKTLLVDAGGNVTETAGFGITGIQRGYGPWLAPHVPAPIPFLAPARSTMPATRLLLNDGGLGLAFPYLDAYNAARDDPANDLKGFIADHPSARLVAASYDRRMLMEGGVVSAGDAGRLNAMNAFETDGGWGLVFTDGEAALGLTVIRASGARTHDGTPLTTGQSAAKKTSVETFATEPRAVPSADVNILTSPARAKLALTHGVEPGSLEGFRYQIIRGEDGTHYASTHISQIPPGWSGAQEENLQGVALSLNETLGGLTTIDDVWKTSRPPATVPSLARDQGIDRDTSREPATLTLSTAPISRGEGLSERDTRLIAAAASLTGFAVLILALKFLVLPLFTRLHRTRLLDNPVRALLFERIRRDPGVHLASLIRVGNVGRGATRHHLDMLTKHGFLKAREDGGFLRYFVTGEVSSDEARRTAALRAGSHSAVHALYREEPTLTLREAAARLDMSAPNVHRIRKKLVAAGLLEA